MTGSLKAITDWIARETPSDARVLFEESGDETGFAPSMPAASSADAGLPQVVGVVARRPVC